MSIVDQRHPGFVILLNNEPFFLYKDETTGAPSWKFQQFPTQDGDPTNPGRFRWNDWSHGVGDSRGMFKGAVENCEKAWLGSPGRILPGPALTTIATGHTGDITCFVDVTLPAARLLAGGGTKVSEINSSHTVSASNTFGAGTVTSMALFIDQVAIALGAGTDFQRRSAAGAYSVNTLAGLQDVQCFGLSPEGDLVRGKGAAWAKCSASDFYGTENWSLDLTLGDASGNIQQVIGHNRWDYVLKDEGLYWFDPDTSQESNALTDLVAFKSSQNRAYFRWYDQLYICTLAGLFRFISSGAARTVGAEEIESNESVLANSYPTAGAAFGKWAYIAYYNPGSATTYICVARRAREGDASFGSPLTIVSIIDSFSGNCRAMQITNFSGSPELYYGVPTGNVKYMALTRNGLPTSFQSSGTTKVMMPPTEFGSVMTRKEIRSIQCIAKNLTGGQTVQFKVGVDGAAVANFGSALQALTGRFGEAFSSGVNAFVGRTIALEADMALVSPSAPPEIREIVVNFEERPTMVDGAEVLVRLDDMIEEGGYASRKTAQELKDLLEDMVDGDPVTVTDPEGTVWAAGRLFTLGAEPRYEFRGEKPQYVARFGLRKLDYA